MALQQNCCLNLKSPVCKNNDQLRTFISSMTDSILVEIVCMCVSVYVCVNARLCMCEGVCVQIQVCSDECFVLPYACHMNVSIYRRKIYLVIQTYSCKCWKSYIVALIISFNNIQKISYEQYFIHGIRAEACSTDP